MEYLVGVILGLVVAGFARLVGLDQGRSFYPTVAIVVASYYALFAVMGGSRTALEIEIAIGLGFAAFATLGFKKSMWLVAAALAGHGVFDLLLHPLIENAGMPVWWPGFCASIDLTLGGWMAVRLLKGDGHRV
ncbi:MAG: hypothetical protein ABI693_08860 [Bryobacteraceae bacterium]